MATLLDAGKELWRALVPPPPPPRGTGPAWPDLYGEEAAQEALQDAQRALRLAEVCVATGAPARRGSFGDIHSHYVEPPQPTEDDLADPDQEWIDVRGFGDAGPYYVRGRR